MKVGDHLTQPFATCPCCHQWTPCGPCTYCGTVTGTGDRLLPAPPRPGLMSRFLAARLGQAPAGAAGSARPTLTVRLRRAVQRRTRRFARCSACGHWNHNQGPCTHCGQPGTPGEAQPAERPALLRWQPGEHPLLLLSVLKWLLLGGVVGVLSGTASALFLAALEWATGARLAHPWLLFGLPAGGVLVAWLYERFGRGSERGNNLILDQIHRPEREVPLRMAPLVLFGTVATHLFGGSAGREGTAVQMGGSLADWLVRLLGLSPSDRRILLMSGISGGFGSVFGTPLAGTVFGMEVLRVGTIRYEALVACLSAAFVGNAVTTAWGIHHSHYAVAAVPAFGVSVFARVLVAGACFGLAALLFSELVHGIKAVWRSAIAQPLVRPVVGAAALIALTYLLGTRAYLGLGAPMIAQSFTAQPVPPLAFFWKTVFTAVTLGSGFQGGEVTPLFFVGATLGNTLAHVLALPVDFLAALGFVAVFAGAANTPLSCILMGAELFGAVPLPYVGIACIISYVFSGHRGIYAAQRVDTPKSKSVPIPPGTALRAVHAVTPPLTGPARPQAGD